MGKSSKATLAEDYPPITHGIVAEPHTPIYKMHRYFARRPHNVFRYLIQHYSRDNDVIYDPFCGGGVTVVEALRLKRKVIGIDLNPMATFISRTEVMPIDLLKFERTFHQIEDKVREPILQLYATDCPKCKGRAFAEWTEMSFTTSCPKCGKTVIIAQAQKIGGGTYSCPHSGCGEKIGDHFESTRLKMADLPLLPEVIVSIKVKCAECGFEGEKKPDSLDESNYRNIENQFDKTIQSNNLWYPQDAFPDGDRARDDNLFPKGFIHFYKFFTKRNLLALAMLLKQIELVSEHDTRLLMEMVFTSTIDWSTKMSRVIKGRQAREITTHSYWVSYVPVEINVWKSFAKRFKAALRGKEYSESEIGEYCQFADSFSDFHSGKTCMLLTQSSHRVPKIPDNSVDVIITDPPYGGNVQYSELTDLWAVWIKKTLGIQGIIENAEEAIQTRHSGFPSAKTLEQYRNMLSEIFRECHRKLKRRGWLVMTFHNRDMAVWNSLIIAAYDAGFMLAEKNGVVYQPAIGAYTTTLHQKVAGSMLGDFIMSFRRADNPPEQKKSDIKDIEDKVFKHIDNVIRYQGGASINMIYMQLIPILTNEGLLHKVAQTDLEPFLRKRYVKTGEKWYFREDIDETGRLKPIELVPSEKRIENLIRSILAEKNEATLDEIYQALYVNLINGMTPEKEQVDQILDRLAEKVATTERARWRLKTQRSLFGEVVPSTKRIKRRPSPVQVQLHDTGKPAHIQEEEFSEHDLMIKRLAEIAFEKGFDVHIGITEQRKNESFRRISRPMGDNVEFGIENEAFKIIQEIDILWFKGRTISSAFEVEFSTTIDSGINRFRNLFAVLPNLNVEAYIVVPDDRVDEARKKINSPANVREGISHRVKAVEFTKVPEIS